jgi:hypothetical protein
MANIENESSVSDEERTEGWTVSAPAPVEDELIGSMDRRKVAISLKVNARCEPPP